MNADTIPAPLPPGLLVYLDGHDVARIDDTIATLHRCAAVAALVLCEGVNGHQVPIPTFVRACERLRAADITPIGFTFPRVTGDLVDSRAHFRACCVAARVDGQLDAEPETIGKDGSGRPVLAHWTPSLLAPWLDADPRMSITTTRAEAGHLGSHNRRTFAQLEAQTSTDTLEQALLVFGRYSEPEQIVLVTGVFDQKDDPRTVDEIRRDLARCTTQAKRSGAHAIWSAHTLTPAKADVHREWALTTF